MPDVAHLLKPKESTPIVSGQTNSGANAMIANRRPGVATEPPSIQTIPSPEANSRSQLSTTTKRLHTNAQTNPEEAIDPISRQILERTKIHHTATRILPLISNDTPFGSPTISQTALPTQDVTEPADVSRKGSVGSVNKALKDKKKSTSLFSRFINTKKKDVPERSSDEKASITGRRPTDVEAELFSRPIGFVPQFPAPPRYFKAKANNRKQKEFERVFLAQILLERPPRSKRKVSGDEEIVNIDEAPAGRGQPFNKAIWAMEFSKDGRYLAAAGQDKKVRVWAVISSAVDREAHEADEEEKNPEEPGIRLNAPVLRTKLVREYRGHTSSVLDLSWSKNNFLLSSSMDKTVRLWHVSRDECLCAFNHLDFVTSIAFHPRDDRFFLAGSLDAKLRLWSIPDKSVAYWANVPDMVTAVSFTPDGKTCIAGCLNGLCLFYDTEKLRVHSQLHVRSARGRNAKGSKITGIDTITLPVGDPNGDVKLLITSNDSRIRMYNYKDRNLEIKFRGNENTCSQIHATFSDDGRYVICGSEDKKVYIWPTGPTEKQDQDKRPVEVLEAHGAIVTSAVLAPAKTRQHLAQSGDPLYDLCNPPPVTLVGNDSPFSSRAQTENGGSTKEPATTPVTQHSNECRKAEESPAYLARHTHPGGNIIVTADYLGQIKVLRQDCAYQKRRYESFDSASMFSRNRLLGRNGSATARTSLSSARNSITNSNLKNPSTDRIINWRESIADGPTSNPGSAIGTDPHLSLQRSRSDSPRKMITQISSPGRPAVAKSTSFTTTSPPSSHTQTSDQSTNVADIRLERHVTSPAVEVDENAKLQPESQGPNNDLYMWGDHSYRYWKQDKLTAMAQREPRVEDLLSPNDTSSNELSRGQSLISRRSSELSHHETVASEADGEGGNEIKCESCGGRSFRARMERGPRFQEKRLSCKRCGSVI